MTESEWLACDRPWDLGDFARGRPDAHRFRFLVVAWGTRIRNLFEDYDRPWFDAFAAWVAGTGDHPGRLCSAPEYLPLDYPNPSQYHAHRCADAIRRDDPLTAAAHAGASAAHVWPPLPDRTDYARTHRGRSARKRQQAEADRRARRDRQEQHQREVARRFCDEFRDVAGNPFRPVAADPRWRTSSTVALAQAMDSSGDFTRMPVLGDALEEAGCDRPDILDHCRCREGVHARGCWVIDFVLSKM